jgi:hypothetical protein
MLLLMMMMMMLTMMLLMMMLMLMLVITVRIFKLPSSENAKRMRSHPSLFLSNAS